MVEELASVLQLFLLPPSCFISQVMFSRSRRNGLHLCVQVLTAQMHEDVGSSQLGSNTVSTSTDTAALEDHPETPRAQPAPMPNSWESTPIAVPVPPAVPRSGEGWGNQLGSYPDTQFDSTQESQLSAENESTLDENRMELSAVDIERWIDGSSSIPARVHRVPTNPVLDAGSHSLQSSLVSARYSTQQRSRASWASAQSNSRFGPEKLLRSSIEALHELERSMLAYENLLIVQLAGVSGVCRALLKSLNKLTKALSLIHI